MRFSIQLPTDRVAAGDEFVGARAISEMARAVEAAGFDACFVTDHPFPNDRWLASGGHHALDPFVALSFVAAATTTLRVQTNIVVLGYRNPFVDFADCRAAATVDNGVDLDNEEQGGTVFVCAPPAAGWEAIWPQLRHLDA